MDDMIAHKGDLVNNPLILTGPDPVPLEIRGPSRDNIHGQVIPRPDLRTTHEEADNILINQVRYHKIFTEVLKYNLISMSCLWNLCIETISGLKAIVFSRQINWHRG